MADELTLDGGHARPLVRSIWASKTGIGQAKVNRIRTVASDVNKCVDRGRKYTGRESESGTVVSVAG
ncbi:hypothetical protein Cob_v000887 [Colletotrichum orbiculare MAFF 240422]|uniref:Uncharacterized protein n=1 Tax=Colletotrichum orbiculare (strain 104-T / ATCC 96160 / CBS 514.97 / LARS 414 / MAFF 240422) TaxID=1213857 RepID=A0A484G7P6_COLOR|nr:hypothetical protein Cob_v000887 [Colletotrichum orbiculare MAFF 240422]